MPHVLRTLLVAAATAIAPMTAAQAADPGPGDFPSKPIRIVVPFVAGGESDIMARLIGTKLGSLPGYTVVVENAPGAGGRIGAAKALREPADGYTLLTVSNAYLSNAVTSKTETDPIGAIQPLIQFTVQPSVLVASLKHRSLAELLTAARQSPGSVSYGSAGIGSLGNFSTEELAMAAGIKMLHVPFKGTGDAISALGGGQIDMMLAGLTGARSLADTGKVRLLAITGTKRVPALPDVPTFAEAGLPAFGTDFWHGLVAPKGVPPAIVAKLNADLNAVLRAPDIRARLAHDYVTAVGGPAEQLRKTMQDELARMKDVAARTGIKAE